MIDYLILVLVAGQFALLAYLFHKIRAMHVQVWNLASETPEKIRRQYEQLESLMALYVELDLKHGLSGTREWAGSPDLLWSLAQHALDNRPEVILECGSGTSTLVLARCAQMTGKGHVYSLDHDPQFAESTRSYLRRHGLEAFATVIDAPLKTHELNGKSWRWYATDRLPESIDMLVVDGPPEDTGPLARYPAGPLLFPRMSKGGTVFLDDAMRRSEKQIAEMWGREFPGSSQTYHNYRHEKGLTVLALPK